MATLEFFCDCSSPWTHLAFHSIEGVAAAAGATLFFAAIAEPSIKDRLRANTDELIARGGFGSPTMFVDHEDMYFGNDRLVLVERALRRQGPADPARPDTRVSTGKGALL